MNKSKWKRCFVLGLSCIVVAAFGTGCGDASLDAPSENNVSDTENITASEDVTFNYVTLEDGTIEVISYEAKNPPKEIRVPTEIDGQTVSAIGPRVFQFDENVKKVVLPDTVREIADSAFFNATSLESVEFSGCIDTVGEYAFSGCSSLKELDFRNGVGCIKYAALDLCENLKDVYLPADVESLEDAAICILCPKVTIHVPAGSQAEELVIEAVEGSDFAGTIVAE